MKAVVVYESHWGNTAAVARAIAEGLGPESQALSTAQATPDALAGIDLLVAGAPVIAFGLPTEKTLEGIRTNPGKAGATRPLSPGAAILAGGLARRQGSIRRLRDARARSVRARYLDHRRVAGEGRIPPGNEARGVRRQGQVRTTSRRRVGASPRVGSRTSRRELKRSPQRIGTGPRRWGDLTPRWAGTAAGVTSG